VSNVPHERVALLPSYFCRLGRPSFASEAEQTSRLMKSNSRVSEDHSARPPTSVREERICEKTSQFCFQENV